MDLLDFEDGRLYLFTSLTAGSSHIITATSRLETILKANKIPFQAIDTATDEKARRLWQRRAQKKKLPGLIKDGYVIGDLEEVEEWNEFGELKENIGDVTPKGSAGGGGGRQGINLRPLEQGSPREHDAPATGPQHPAASKTASALVDESSRVALPGAAEIAARNKSPALPPADVPALESVASAPVGEAGSVGALKETDKHNAALDHVSAPASVVQSANATPQIEPIVRPSEEVGEADAAKTHRGSEVKDAPLDEIKKLESETALPEEPSKEDALESTRQGVESVTFEEPEKP